MWAGPATATVNSAKSVRPAEAQSCEDEAYPAASIYHEPWWLDIATDGQWSEVLVEDGGAAARLRYPLQLAKGRMISRMPTLIRSLGPEFFGLSGKRVTIRRRKTALSRRLIEGLSGLAWFEQVFDPRVEDVAIFAGHNDFTVTINYAYRSAATASEAEAWSEMTFRVRNHIRAASRQFQVAIMDDPGLFCDFHDSCLRGRPNFHGAVRMRRLVAAIRERGRGQVLAALDEKGALVAALLIVWDDDAVRNLISARDPDRAGSGALSVLLFQATRIAAERGLAFDFDGAATPGQLNFLAGFGAELVHRLLVLRTAPGYLPPNATLALNPV